MQAMARLLLHGSVSFSLRVGNQFTSTSSQYQDSKGSHPPNTGGMAVFLTIFTILGVLALSSWPGNDIIAFYNFEIIF
jgi:hypothetical protein